jgi:NAD(P)-dependent dehydrogenase (short-subunit alcohol dehydrogenase family)
MAVLFPPEAHSAIIPSCVGSCFPSARAIAHRFRSKSRGGPSFARGGQCTDCLRPPEQRGGSIINVTSQLAEVARPERAAYVASKRGARQRR